MYVCWVATVSLPHKAIVGVAPAVGIVLVGLGTDFVAGDRTHTLAIVSTYTVRDG